MSRLRYQCRYSILRSGSIQATNATPVPDAFRSTRGSCHVVNVRRTVSEQSTASRLETDPGWYREHQPWLAYRHQQSSEFGHASFVDTRYIAAGHASKSHFVSTVDAPQLLATAHTSFAFYFLWSGAISTVNAPGSTTLAILGEQRWARATRGNALLRRNEFKRRSSF